MKFSIKLEDTNSVISNNIIQSLIPEINTYLKNKLQYVRNNLPSLVNNILVSTDTYASLVGGQLQYEFGIPDPQSKLDEILNIWTNNVVIDYKAPTANNGKIKASFSVSIIRSDFSDVLSSDASLVIDSLRGYSLPWLEWLLLEGNKTIIKNQQVVFKPSKFSRTGMALMRESNTSWKVPSQYAGTISNNWITRAIDDNESTIINFLEKAFD
jgi:hypothetical protein